MNHVLFASEGCTCVSLFYDVLNVSFWDPWRSCSRRGSCQVWFPSITRPERLLNFIISTHMVATSRLCLSELLCSTFSNWGIVIFDHVLYASEVCTCVSFFYDVLNDFFLGHLEVRFPSWVLSKLFFRTKRDESLQNFIIRTHMVTTGRLCLSKPLCPTIFICRIVFWIMFFLHRRVVCVSVYSLTFWMFFWDPWRSRSGCGSCQVWFFRITRAECL